jgi:hypothetical protein
MTAGKRKKRGSKRGGEAAPRWLRLDWSRTVKTGGRRLFLELIANNHASISVPGGLTYPEFIGQVASTCSTPIPIEHLSDIICGVIPVRGRTVFGSPGEVFDEVAERFGSIWWIAEKGLNMEAVVPLRPKCPPFDEFVGRLIVQKTENSNTKNRLWPPETIMEIAVALDIQGFVLLDNLERTCKEDLTVRNRKYNRNAIKTFVGALRSDLPWLRHGVKNRIYRSKAKYLPN